ncbi:hypothetical protein [uncultured Paraglaciecola sp.]|uniref:hypothetical protein n=1 Tax=uncultured Paraglaciecola sp. TaxID=1765024 RepID=UPI002621F147|nr:hypothetical protein [uncultured Paraglaciecola sp.]
MDTQPNLSGMSDYNAMEYSRSIAVEAIRSGQVSLILMAAYATFNDMWLVVMFAALTLGVANMACSLSATMYLNQALNQSHNQSLYTDTKIWGWASLTMWALTCAVFVLMYLVHGS